MARTQDIEIVSDSPVIGRLGTDRRIERMMRDYGQKYHALRIVHELLIDDAHTVAQTKLPKALLAAANLRNGHQPGPDDLDSRGRKLGKRASALRSNGAHREVEDDTATPEPRGRKYSTKHKKKRFTVQEGSNKYGIGGSRITLYLLEHLRDDQYIEKSALLEMLRADGYPVAGLLALNAPLGVQIYRTGFAKKKGTGYKRTAAGRKHAVKLRSLLVEANMVEATGYNVPANAPTKRVETTS